MKLTNAVLPCSPSSPETRVPFVLECPNNLGSSAQLAGIHLLTRVWCSTGAGSMACASVYLHKSEYLDLGLEGKTTAFFHSKGAAVAL